MEAAAKITFLEYDPMVAELLRAAAVREREVVKLIDAIKTGPCRHDNSFMGETCRLCLALADYCKATADNSRPKPNPNPEEKK
jgi:hypothetical protein